MMKKSFKNRSAVSPVIATILMVAITVVLAAVLYVMVMGFGSGPSSNPTIALSKSSTAIAHQERIEVTSITEATPYSNLKISLVGTTSTVGTAPTGTTTVTYTWSTPLSATSATGIVSCTLTDLLGDGKLGAGDYFLVTAIGNGTPITLSLLYGSESASIASSDWVST